MGGHLLLVTGKVGYAVRDGAWLWPQDLCVCVYKQVHVCAHGYIYTSMCVCLCSPWGKAAGLHQIGELGFWPLLD